MENEQRIGWGYWVSLLITILAVISLSHFYAFDHKTPFLVLSAILTYCFGVLLLILGLAYGKLKMMFTGVVFLFSFVGVALMF